MARVLVFSRLYPSAAAPNHGVFVETRLLQTLALGGLEATVIAPVPYFPSSHPIFGHYAVYAGVPEYEVREGVDVWHPRYLAVPMAPGFAPQALLGSAMRTVRRLREAGRTFDVIDAHYFYPDGVAAAGLGKALRVPVVITARGTDLTLMPRNRGAQLQILQAAAEASASIAVCEDLRRRLVNLGAAEERTLTLRNGVDLELFSTGDRDVARTALDVEGFVLLSVGALIPRKGHALVLESLRRSPDCRLLLAGSGPLRADLEKLARDLGVAERVRFLGEVPHHELPDVYRAADASILASDREGWANVLLESMACGTPVIATDVNGTSEVVRKREAGLLVRERTPEALAVAVDILRRQPPGRAATRRYAEAFGWDQVAAANRAVLQTAARLGYARRHSAEAAICARKHLDARPEHLG
jgi:glycosyltransferase involved in cell wall biosynthesis